MSKPKLSLMQKPNFTTLYNEAKRLGHAAKFSVSTSSIYLEYPARSMNASGAAVLMAPRELGFISKVMRHADKLPAHTPAMFQRWNGQSFTNKDIRYFRQTLSTRGIKEKQKILFREVVEVDLTAAYFHAALHLGIISEEIYKAAETQTKKARLVSLGALASKKNIFSFDGEKESFELKHNEPRANYFFSCAKLVDEILSEAIQVLPIYFYWVDAVFLPAEHEAAARDFFANFGLPCKTKNLNSLKVILNPQKRLISYLAEETESGKRKIFSIPE
jgi:hypothetical protein